MTKPNMAKALLIAVAVVSLIIATAGMSWAVQLLINPGFEEGWRESNADDCGIEASGAGWTWSTIDPNPPIDPDTGQPFYPCSGFWNGGVTAWGGGTRVHSGNIAQRAFHYGGLHHPYVGYRWSSIRQEVRVVPDRNYTASAWFYVWHNTNYDIGSESFFQLKVEEVNSAGAVIATHIEPVTTINAWVNPTINFRSNAATERVRLWLISRIYHHCEITHVTYDDCALEGPSPLSLELLANPGFEAGVPSWNGDSCGGEDTIASWTYSTTNPFGASLCSGFWNAGATTWSGGTRVHSGATAVRAFSYTYEPGFWYSSIRQVAAVVPDSDYTASAWVYIWKDPAYTMEPGAFVRFEVQELDNFDMPIGSPRFIEYTDVADMNTWKNPSIDFHTTAQTEKVEFKLSEYTAARYDQAHINWDDCSLSGPSPFTLQGTVTSGGSPLAGAEVAAGMNSVETAADGTYSMPVPSGGVGLIIRASKEGYFAQKKLRVMVRGTNTVDFDLTPVGSNLLKNPGFDDNQTRTPYTAVSDFWTAVPADATNRESFFMDTGYGGYFHSGEEATGLISDTVPGEARIVQAVPILPGSPYTASVWVRAAGLGGMWYEGSDQKAGLVIQQFNKGGDLVAEHTEYLTDFANWQKLSYSFTSDSTAVLAKVFGWANLLDRWSDTLNRAVFDDFELSGAAGPALPPLFGTVKSGTTPLGDARVYSMTTGHTTYTDADGTWALNPPAQTHWLRTLKPGYYTQRKFVSSPSIDPVRFDLVDKNSNLLVNAGFDDGPYEGWTEEQSGSGNAMRRAEYIWIQWDNLGTAYYTSGQEAICLFNTDSSEPGGCWYYQIVPVVGGQTYTARVKTKISVPEGAPSIWGYPGDEQVAGLRIEEYDASGNLVLAHPLLASNELPDWEQLSNTFLAQPATKTIKIGPYIWSLENARSLGWARVTFDDVELNGPLGEYGLSGTVKSGTTPISGAVVQVSVLDGATTTYTTDINGKYTAEVPYGAQCTIRVSRAGYYVQTKTATVTSVTVVDFDMFSVGDNLLFNPNFDDPAGWSSGGWVPVGAVWWETHTAQFGPAYFYSLPEAVYMRSSGTPVESRVYQDVPVLPNTSYTACVQFRAGTDPRYGSAWGIDPSQVGALTIEFLDAQKVPIPGTETRVYADVTLENRDLWRTLCTTVQTTADTAYIRVGGYANMIDNYDANLARALFDNFVLSGPPAGGQSLAQIKALADGSSVRLLGKVVTASFNGYFYIEEADRSSGIRVNGSANAGDVVDILGTITTANGERLISSSNIIQRSVGMIPKPLGATKRAIDVGLSAVGLYMTVWGEVDSVGSDSFTISDGSGTSLKVYGTATAGSYVSVTGAIGAEMSGTDVVPVMRAVQVRVQP